VKETKKTVNYKSPDNMSQMMAPREIPLTKILEVYWSNTNQTVHECTHCWDEEN